MWRHKKQVGPAIFDEAPPIELKREPNEETQIMNVTGHMVQIGDEQFDSMGMVRLNCISTIVWKAGNVPVSKTTYEIGMLPQKVDNLIYIVSVIMCQMNHDRWDFYIPSSKDRLGVFQSVSRNPFYKEDVN